MKFLLYFEKFSMKWDILLSNPDKIKYADNLIDVTDIAYRSTDYGSFVKSVNDIFYR